MIDRIDNGEEEEKEEEFYINIIEFHSSIHIWLKEAFAITFRIYIYSQLQEIANPLHRTIEATCSQCIC